MSGTNTLAQLVHFEEVDAFLAALAKRMDKGTEELIDSVPVKTKRALTYGVMFLTASEIDPKVLPSLPEGVRGDSIYHDLCVQYGLKEAILDYRERRMKQILHNAEMRAYSKQRDQEVRKLRR